MTNKQKLIQYIETEGKGNLSWLELAEKFNIKPDSTNQQRGKAANDIWRNYKKHAGNVTKRKVWQLPNGETRESLTYEYGKQNEFSLLKEELLKTIEESSPATQQIYSPPAFNKSRLLEISLPDLHFGGEENIEVTKAKYIETVKSLAAQASIYDIEKIILPIGNDGVNSEGKRMTTTKGTPQRDSAPWYTIFVQYWELIRDTVDFLSSIAPVDIIVVSGNHDCYSDDTEVLTERGFIHHVDLLPNDKIATVNNITLETEYQPYKNYFTKDYEGKMIEFSHRNLNSLVTPKHRMFVRRAEKDFYEYKESKDLLNTTNYRFRNKGENYNKDFPIEDNWLKLFAWINSDGSKKDENTYSIYQSKPNMIEEIKNVLNELDITYRENIRNRKTEHILGKRINNIIGNQYEFHFNAKHTSKEHLKFLSENIVEKYNIPSILKKCSKRQVELYLKEYIKGDGTFATKNVASIYGTEKILSQLQVLCIDNGFGTKLHINSRGDFVLYVNFKTVTNKLKPSQINEVEYKGKVWCLTTPNSNFITRRKGVQAIQGNCEISFHLGEVLRAWYSSSFNVTVNNTPEPRKYYSYGTNFLMFTHGDKEKSADLPLIMATEKPKEFAEATYREVHCGHFHKEMVNEYRGIKVRYLPSIAKTSSWTNEMGWNNLKCAQAYLYHPSKGCTGYLQVNLDD